MPCPPRVPWATCLLAVALLASGDRPAIADADAPKPDVKRDAEVDRAVSRATDYLFAQQLPSGAWRSDQYGEMTSMTSLALMACLAAGIVPGEGPHAANIDRAVRWVLDHQRDDGMLIDHVSHGPMYCHGISTLMLAEVAGMTPRDQNEPVRKALEQAIKVILAAQDRPKPQHQAGGWRYQPNSGDSDLSVTGWQLLALRAARNIGCDVPAENIDRAVAYVKRCSVRGNHGFGYQPGDGATAVRSGTGILALEICGEHHAPESLGAAEFILHNPLRYEENFFFYGAYYCGLGMFQIGGASWETSRDSLYAQLLTRQEANGSWQAANGGELGVGRNYSTSMAVLSLTVEYQYLPIYQR